MITCDVMLIYEIIISKLKIKGTKYMIILYIIER
jgi:hypothetical protein